MTGPALTLTRRGAIGAVAAAPVAAAGAHPSIWKHDSGLPAAIAALRTAQAEEAAHERTRLEPAQMRYDAAAAHAPHVTVDLSSSRDGSKRASTADTRAVERCRRYIQTLDDSFPGIAGKPCPSRSLVEAADKIADELARLKDDSGLRSAEDEAERLAERTWDAIDRVVSCPVADADDLVAKLRVVSAFHQFDLESVQSCLAADLERIEARVRLG